jgi:hypothetical protein
LINISWTHTTKLVEQAIPLEQRNALDAVQVAACFADPKNLSTSMISQGLRVQWETMEKSRECAENEEK